MSLSALRDEFKQRALDPERLFLLSGRDALAFIDKCAAEGLVLLGVEGFRVADLGAFQPEQTQSNDIADGSLTQAQFVAATKELINRGLSLGYVYEVVIDQHGV